MRCAPSYADLSERIAALRNAASVLQAISAAALPKQVRANAVSPITHGLPGPGLPCGVLNEVIAVHADRLAAFGFVFALMAAAQRSCAGPAAFIAARHTLDFGVPYGHGLTRLGLDVRRLILIETQTDKEALWALDEMLRSEVRPAVVAGVVKSGLDLTQSRRLNLAATLHATPLVVLRGAKGTETSAAATRWRLAPATLDRFGTFDRWLWQVTLERCRNGRTGTWQMQWNPETCRFQALDEGPATDIALPTQLRA